MGGANGGSEIVKMWKDYNKGILNSENSVNGSAQSVEHSIDCKENNLGLEMPMCPFFLQFFPFFFPFSHSSKAALEQISRA